MHLKEKQTNTFLQLMVVTVDFIKFQTLVAYIKCLDKQFRPSEMSRSSYKVVHNMYTCIQKLKKCFLKEQTSINHPYQSMVALGDMEQTSMFWLAFDSLNIVNVIKTFLTLHHAPILQPG